MFKLTMYILVGIVTIYLGISIYIAKIIVAPEGVDTRQYAAEHEKIEGSGNRYFIPYNRDIDEVAIRNNVQASLFFLSALACVVAACLEYRKIRAKKTARETE